MDINENDLKNLLPAAKDKQLDVIQKIIEEEDADKVKDLTHLFNINQTKREIIRLNALNDVQDALVNQMMERLKNTPDNFNNSDISSWLKVVQGAMDSSQKNIGQVDAVPTITYQQNNQININPISELSKESRDKISDVLQKILQSNNEDKNIVDLNDEDIVYNDDENVVMEDNNE